MPDMKKVKPKAIKLSPQKLARIIAECACKEMGASSSGGSGLDLPAPLRNVSAPSQESVDAGLFPGMGETPALSDSGGASCGPNPSPSSTDSANTFPAGKNEEGPVNKVPDAADEDDDDTVELVIGSIW